jgi:steroid delta-isomerase-like uncharacterized protein
VADEVRELLARDVAADEYDAIRDLWKRHSIAEDKRDLPGLIATLTEDCVYEIAGVQQRWEGHDGAARFYTQLLSAFPDIHFELSNIVIGPQGVCEEASVTGTHKRDWLGVPASGEHLTWTVVIFFPWDREAKKFRGEKVYVEGLPALTAARAAAPDG